MSELTVRNGQPTRAGTPARSATDYDVVVVGGRVAGASTALLLARQGHRVLVVERSRMPSDTVSTHAILRTGVLQLTRWGLLADLIAAGTPPIRGVTLGFGDDRIVFDVRPEYGVDFFLAPRRYILDDILLRKAEEAGAHVVDGTTMKELLWSGDGTVSGVRVGRGDSTRTISTRYVIGADGHHSRVAELVDAALTRHHPATNAVHYAYYRGIESNHFWFQFTPGVNAGLIPTNDGQCLVFAGRPSGLSQRFTRDPDTEMKDLLKTAGPDLAEVVGGGTRVSRYFGTTGLSGSIRRVWGPGWALVGDAGHTKDPISAHGISNALRDAELCARAVDRALNDPAEASTALAWYETLRNTLSQRIFEESCALAGYQWDPEEASARMRVISEEVRGECDALVSLPEWAAVSALARV